MGLYHIKVEINTKVMFRMIKNRVRELIIIVMEIFLEVNSKMIVC